MNEVKQTNPIWTGILGICIIGGLITVVRLISQGHYILSADDNIIWTLPVSSYVFFALMSTGIVFISSFPLIFKWQEFESIVRRLVFLAIVTLISGFVSIGIEVGSAGKIIYFLLSPNPASPIWWMGILYIIEMVLLIIKFRSLSEGKPSGKALTMMSASVSVAAALMLGFVFGAAESRASYFGPYMSVYTITMAFLSGCAVVLVFDSVKSFCSDSQREYLSRTFSFLLVVGIIVVLLRSVLAAAHTDVQVGNSGWLSLFLVASLLIGVFSSGRNLLAGIVALAGILLLHMNIIIGGQIYPVGPKAEGLPAVLSYTPNIWEVLVFLFALSLGLMVYKWGDTKLKLGFE